MFRRLMSLFVLAGFLTGQYAGVAHSHAGLSGDEQQRHDSQPHVHLDHWLIGEHESDHGHDHGHRHDTPHSGQSLTHAHSGEQFTLPAHEEDAIYVVPSGVAATENNRSSLILCGIQSLVPVWFLPSDDALKGFLATWRPTEAATDESGIYLTLRTLRI